NLDGRVTTNTTDITNLQKQIGDGSVGLVQQDATTRNITVAAGTNGAVVDFTGTAGARKLTGVANGTNDHDAVNVSQLKQSGLVDNNGNALAAVTYDVNADGTTNYGSVTLGGQNAAGPVQLHNVADGTAETDAVNLRQLKQAGLVDNSGNTLDAVTYDAGSNRTQVTFGNAGAPVLLSNVQAGMANTDAANVGQLRGLASGLGGGAGIGADGAYIAPSYTFNDVTYNNVGDALSGLATQIGQTGDRVTVVEKVVSTGESNAHVATSGDQANAASATGANAAAIGAGASASNSNSVALGAGSTTDRDNTISVGSAGSERAITNVANAVMDTDAVNKRSMDTAVAGAKSYTDQQIGMVQQALGDVSRKAYSGIAGATALTMIPDVDQGKTIAVGVGVGSYQGYAASAIGVSARLSDRIKVKMGASVSGAGTTYGAGASYQW
ncbi:YadA family autotransporter adhesin, partial [Ralstonia insidiosa]